MFLNFTLQSFTVTVNTKEKLQRKQWTSALSAEKKSLSKPVAANQAEQTKQQLRNIETTRDVTAGLGYCMKNDNGGEKKEQRNMNGYICKY